MHTLGKIPKGARPALVPSPSSTYWVTGAIYRVVKRPSREADNSPPSVPRLRINGSISSLPIHLYDMHRDNFTFTYMHCSVAFCAWQNEFTAKPPI
jgi:hypothetical protein